MDWFKKHADAMAVIGTILGSVLWMNTQFNKIDKEISQIDKEIAIVKTVLIMKNIMPNELAKKDNEIK